MIIQNEKEKKKRIIFSLSILLGIALIVIGLIGLYLLQISSTDQAGTIATDFSITDLNGNTFQLNKSRGKVVIIDFMATWCGPCRQQLPHLRNVWETYNNSIVLISIDVDPTESEDALRSFVQGFPYATWIWARDTANLAQSYQVTAIPKTVIIDKDGYIRLTHVGVASSSTLIQEIEQLLD